MPTKMTVWHGNGLIRKETPHPLLFMVQHPFSTVLQYCQHKLSQLLSRLTPAAASCHQAWMN